MAISPKGRRVRVNAPDSDIYESEFNTTLSQHRGTSLSYGFRENLYQPVNSIEITDLRELAGLRRQILRYGLPVGFECELEVEASSILASIAPSARENEYNLVVAKANRNIRNYLRQQSERKGWESFRYQHMVIHKGDPSLNRGGEEFVFSPMTPDFAKASGAYSVFEQTFSTYLWMGHYGPNTGGHMHIPMGVFSNQQLVLYYKLIEFFADARVFVKDHPNPELAARFLQIVGQRKLGGWAKWVRLPSVQAYDRILSGDNGRSGINGNRNYIVQRTGHGTIEHRFPKGTYNAERAIMRSQFINAMYSFTYMVEQRAYTDRDAVKDIWDINKFLLHVNQDQRWPELKRYLRRNFSGINVVTSRGRNTTVSEDIEAYYDLFVDMREHATERIS